MREIMFRGYDEVDKKWLYGLPSYNDVGEITEIQVNKQPHSEFIGVNPKTVGQYTGKNDIEGNEVYEGDICNGGKLRCTGNYTLISEGNIVTWKDHMFKLGTVSLCSFPNLKVIGNIHDKR